MQAKEYLSQAMSIDKRIREKKESILRLRDMTERVTQSLSLTPHGTDGEHGIDAAVARIVDVEREMEQDIAKLTLLRVEILQTIDAVPDDDARRVLALRYLDYKEWSEIAREMEVSIRWAHKLHAKGLAQVDEICTNVQ